MALEDFTTYTVAGAQASKVSINSPTEIFIDSFVNNDEIIIYKDLGQGIFTAPVDISIYFDMQFVSTGGNALFYTGLSDVVGPAPPTTSPNNMYFSPYGLASLEGRVHAKAGDVSGVRTDRSGFSATARTYCWLRRLAETGNKDQVFCGVYGSANDRELVQNPLMTTPYSTINGSVWGEMRYLHPFVSRNGLNDNGSSLYIRDMEVVSPEVTPPEPGVKVSPLFFGQDF